MNTDLIIALIIGLAIIIYFGYKKMFPKEDSNSKDEPKSNEERLSNKKRLSMEENTFENEKKILKYFGGDYCPHSNSNSNAYKVIKDLENEYSDRVTVKYYWVGLDDEYMKELNVEYVPYILNGDNQQIEIALPEGTDASNLSEEELKELLLNTIYNKL